MAFYRCVKYKRNAGTELPIGYKRCKYLESSRKQYVNLGIIYAFEFSIDCYIPAHNGGFLGYFKNPYEIIIQPIGEFAFVGASSTNKDTTVGLPFDGHLEFSDNKLYVNGVHKYTSPSSPVVPSPRDFLLFGYRGTNVNLGIGKIRSLKIRNAKYETIYNFVPSIDQSGKPCMYDTVSKKTFYNQGSGEFGYELEDGTYVAPI